MKTKKVTLEELDNAFDLITDAALVIGEYCKQNEDEKNKSVSLLVMGSYDTENEELCFINHMIGRELLITQAVGTLVNNDLSLEFVLKRGLLISEKLEKQSR